MLLMKRGDKARRVHSSWRPNSAFSVHNFGTLSASAGNLADIKDLSVGASFQAVNA